jgi:hypothetical protein
VQNFCQKREGRNRFRQIGQKRLAIFFMTRLYEFANALSRGVLFGRE